MTEFTHLDSKGNAIMVDVSEKKPTIREAIASAIIHLDQNTFSKLMSGNISKGDAFSVARVAGIMAAKKVDELIPLCHSIPITSVEIEFSHDSIGYSIEITSKVRCYGVTGVEMEALTSVSVAALTLYDMCKALNKGIVISNIKLLKKSGGKSGTWNFQGEETNSASSNQ